MTTRPSVDADLLEEARRLGGLRTGREAVELALREFVRRRGQREVIELFGTMDPDPGYDYKRARER